MTTTGVVNTALLLFADDRKFKALDGMTSFTGWHVGCLLLWFISLALPG
jgi:hypothetical protein